MKTYNVLILGSGGREHALLKTIKKSKLLNKLYITSTCTILAQEAIGIDLDPLDHKALQTFVFEHAIDLIIPGSEVYLENGVADLFEETDVIVFGPKKEAAKIETSKTFAKELMEKYQIPTASFKSFTDFEQAKSYVLKRGVPIVIKYDGLAAGKGVVVAFTKEEAIHALDDMLNDHKFGDARVVIEDYLEGEEFSFISLIHHNDIIPLPVSKDYKRLLDGDRGPNTGGMGSISPVEFVTKEIEKQVIESILKPTLDGLKQEGITYQGFLYAGLILTDEGPKVIEFNARLGDPETEVILAKVTSDFLETMIHLVNGHVKPLMFDDLIHFGVVMASKGYPGVYEKGYVIDNDLKDDSYLHMGIKKDGDQFVTHGGRVLFVKGEATTFEEVKQMVYDKVSKINCQHLVYRKDIGKGAKQKTHSLKGIN